MSKAHQSPARPRPSEHRHHSQHSQHRQHCYASQLLATSALVIGLAACSSAGHSGQPPAGSSSGSPSASAAQSADGPFLGALFSGTIYVNNGITNQTKSFVYRDRAAQNCAAAVQGKHGIFKIPTGQAPDPQAQIEVADFHGPGTYTPTMLSHDRQDSILLTGKSGISQYLLTSAVAGRTPGKEVLFLHNDGSGQLVYSGAHLDGQVGNPAVAGLVQWTCKS